MLEGTYQGTPDVQEEDGPEGRTFWPKGRRVQGLKVDGKGRAAGSNGKTAGVKSRAARVSKEGPQAAVGGSWVLC